MPRKHLIRSHEHPYHLVARCNNRENFYCETSQVWEIFSQHLSDIEKMFEIKVHALVVMKNHFHLLMSTPQHNIDVVMHRLMWLLTRSIRLKSGRTGRIFGSRYHWSLVDTINYFDYVQKYIYRNPVKARICSKVEHYPYSTVQNLIQTPATKFTIMPIHEESLIPQNNLNNYLHWLNEPFKTEMEDAIRTGLKKTTFQPPKKNWKRKAMYFEKIRPEQ